MGGCAGFESFSPTLKEVNRGRVLILCGRLLLKLQIKGGDSFGCRGSGSFGLVQSCGELGDPTGAFVDLRSPFVETDVMFTHAGIMFIDPGVAVVNSR